MKQQFYISTKKRNTKQQKPTTRTRRTAQQSRDSTRARKQEKQEQRGSENGKKRITISLILTVINVSKEEVKQ
jgi:hypothetical protein